MNEDDYINNRLNKHLEEQEQLMPVCNICGETIDEDNEYCSHCETNVVVITHQEYLTDEYESTMEDRHKEEKEREC